MIEDKTQSATKEAVAAIVEVLGCTSTQLAREAGVVPSTLNRFLNSENVKHTLSARTIEKISEAAILLAKDNPDTSLSALKAAIARLSPAPQFDPNSAQLTPIQLDKSVPVKGVVQAGYWMPVDELLALEGDPVRVSSKEFGGKYTYFALQVRGNSMDQFFKEGDFVICVPYSEYPKDLMGGEFVVVQRSRNGEAEATVKQIEKRGDEILLYPRSMDPTHGPIKYEPQDQMFDDGGDDPIKILAVVRGHTGTFW
jgi:SOS-response transcriptional repressor LexA